MLVKELIEELQKLNPEAIAKVKVVYTSGCYNEYQNEPVSYVSDLCTEVIICD